MISSGYNSQGGNQLSTSGLSFAPPPGMGGNLPFDPTAAIRERLRREAEQTAFENRMREREMRLRERMARQASQPPSRPPVTNREFNTPSGPARPDYGPTPRSLGRFQMNHTGNWGTFVDPADIPAGLQDKIQGGFYGMAGNWDSSNPSIMGPRQFRTGQYTHSGGAQGASIGPGGEGYEPEERNPNSHLSPYEQARLQRVAFGGR